MEARTVIVTRAVRQLALAALAASRIVLTQLDTALVTLNGFSRRCCPQVEEQQKAWDLHRALMPPPDLRSSGSLRMRLSTPGVSSVVPVEEGSPIKELRLPRTPSLPLMPRSVSVGVLDLTGTIS
eukprot:1368913-Prymnesium_polylepis.1